MAKHFHLAPLLELSNLRLDQAARQLGQLINGERQAKERLELLVQYRNEYQALFLAAAEKGLDPQRWHNYRQFLAKIDEAIEQARTMTNTARQRTTAGQKHWLDQRGKAKAFDTLAQRFRARIAYEESRNQQKLMDEHAARFFGEAED
ncbi:flagellar export protein FliJ [Sulfuricystis multivorans]|uniref:flagellar export protein FliJ n=1 Tax=Sulfuricystis multivorans TaxID=2211108 RepID=UPI000F84DDB2|nr:flagellar export protein FliJ [Sulfuricystis multivorans]